MKIKQRKRKEDENVFLMAACGIRDIFYVFENQEYFECLAMYAGQLTLCVFQVQCNAPSKERVFIKPYNKENHRKSICI